MTLADTLLWLCEIASPIGEEQALCNAVTQRLEATTLAGKIRRYGDSIVVPLCRGSGHPHVALVGHLDVVRTVHDRPPRIEGDRLYGAGAADMKSGLALMLHIAEQTQRPNLDLTMVFYAREEGPFVENELGPVLEQDPDLSRQTLRWRSNPVTTSCSSVAAAQCTPPFAFMGAPPTARDPGRVKTQFTRPGRS